MSEVLAGLPVFHTQPLYQPLLPWLGREPFPRMADLDEEARARDLRSGGGQPLRFLPGDPGQSYEAQLFAQGVACTRPDNWHDYFGALVWLIFPRTKAVINRLHQAALSATHDTVQQPRGAVRDFLTQWDECGVVVLCSEPSLWEDLCAHRWHRLFVERRAELASSMRFLLLGHGSYDSLRAPFFGLCAKALCLSVAPEWLHQALSDQLQHADERLADWLVNHPALHPRCLQPLPLLGLPGVSADNENPAYYADARQFRPRRQVQSAPEVRQAIAASQ